LALPSIRHITTTGKDTVLIETPSVRIASKTCVDDVGATAYEEDTGLPFWPYTPVSTIMDGFRQVARVKQSTSPAVSWGDRQHFGPPPVE
jgi:hypothetical protein